MGNTSLWRNFLSSEQREQGPVVNPVMGPEQHKERGYGEPDLRVTQGAALP